jgi:organic radical activating enzyme/uncharacterized protein YbdZ (MbtH family)
MSNQFCRYLSNGYSFYINKDKTIGTAPCCLFPRKNSIPLDSQILQNRKLKFESIDQWTDNCSICKGQEDSGQQSLRQSGPDWIADSETSLDPISMDINFDNECNAACVICNSKSSSLWAKEEAKLHNKKIKINRDNEFIADSIDQIVDTVSLKKLKYVKFYGGEPLFTDTHLKFIKHIPYPENVTLHYTTNGSIYPSEETLIEWKKFKTIIFAASLDGIEDQFNYLRWPLPWNKVSQNLIRLKENKDIWNVLFRVEFTANHLNAYYFDQLENWIQHNLNTNGSGDKTEINIHPCWGGVWDIEMMPENIRIKILKKYPSSHIIHRMVANLPPPTSMNTWKKFVDTWDNRRNNRWQTAFPDLIIP